MKKFEHSTTYINNELVHQDLSFEQFTVNVFFLRVQVLTVNANRDQDQDQDLSWSRYQLSMKILTISVFGIDVSSPRPKLLNF
jgi:hypothetical protein